MKKPVHFAFALALFFFTHLAAGRVLLSLYALHLGASAFTVGLILGIFYVFPVLLSWPIGRLVDRVGAQGVLVVGAALGIVSLLVPYFFETLVALYVSSLLQGLALAFYNVTLQSVTGMLSSPEDRTRNFANLSLIGSLSNAIGPALTGWWMDHSGPALASLYLVFFPAGAMALTFVIGGRLPRGGGKPTAKTRMLDALAQPGVWRMLAVSGLVQLAMDLWQFFIPVFGHSKALSNSAIGLSMSAFSAASFAVRTVLPRVARRFGELRVLEISFYIAAIGYVAVPFSSNAVMLSVVSFLFGLGIGSSAPLTMAMIFGTGKGGRSSEALGLRLTANNIVRVFGPSLFGLLASGFGLAAMFGVAALTMGAGALVARPRGGAKAP